MVMIALMGFVRERMRDRVSFTKMNRDEMGRVREMHMTALMGFVKERTRDWVRFTGISGVTDRDKMGKGERTLKRTSVVCSCGSRGWVKRGVYCIHDRQ